MRTEMFSLKGTVRTNLVPHSEGEEVDVYDVLEIDRDELTWARKGGMREEFDYVEKKGFIDTIPALYGPVGSYSEEKGFRENSYRPPDFDAHGLFAGVSSNDGYPTILCFGAGEKFRRFTLERIYEERGIGKTLKEEKEEEEIEIDGWSPPESS